MPRNGARREFPLISPPTADKEVMCCELSENFRSQVYCLIVMLVNNYDYKVIEAFPSLFLGYVL